MPISKVWDFVILVGILLYFSLCLSLENPTDFRTKVVNFIGKAAGEPGSFGEFGSCLCQPLAYCKDISYSRLFITEDLMWLTLRIVWTTSPRAGWRLSKHVRWPHTDVAQCEVGLLEGSQGTLGIWAALLWQLSCISCLDSFLQSCVTLVIELGCRWTVATSFQGWW